MPASKWRSRIAASLALTSALLAAQCRKEGGNITPAQQANYKVFVYFPRGDGYLSPIGTTPTDSLIHGLDKLDRDISRKTQGINLPELGTIGRRLFGTPPSEQLIHQDALLKEIANLISHAIASHNTDDAADIFSRSPDTIKRLSFYDGDSNNAFIGDFFALIKKSGWTVQEMAAFNLRLLQPSSTNTLPSNTR